MSKITLVQGSCADQNTDVIVNAANRNLWAGSGICGVIFKKAGSAELTAECEKQERPLKDGEAVLTSACRMKNTKAIIHAVGPDYEIEVLLCVFSANQIQEAASEFDKYKF